MGHSLYVEGIRWKTPEKDSWDCVKNEMQSFGLSQRVHSLGINGRELKGQVANPGYLEKWPLKCLCACAG